MHRFRSDLEHREVAHIDVPLVKRMMCLNESSLDCYQAVRKAFLARMEQVSINRYFSDITAQLADKLAAYIGYGVTPQQVVWGSGADDMLFHTFLAVRENEKSFIAAMSPSYFDYKRYANAVGLQTRFVQLDENFDFDLDEYLALAQDPDCKLCVICQPNNPTGNLFDEEKITAVLRAVEIPVLIDETYFEFSCASFVDRLDEFPNLLLVRSFSKAFSAAGLRFGYVIGSRENTDQIRKVMTFFHSSIFIQAMALTMLEHAELFMAHTREVCRLRDELYHQMQAMDGLRVWPSHTNFLLFSIGERAPILYRHLQEHEIAVRNVGAHPLLRNNLRVTATSPEDNAAFLSAVQNFLES